MKRPTNKKPVNGVPSRRTLEAALARGVRAAAREHKLHGVPMAVWENGKVVMIPPDKIDAAFKKAAKRPRRRRAA